MSRPADDVRMQGFTRRQTVAQALAWIDARIAPLAGEAVALRDAAGRVLATSIVSDVDVPGFDRATMDGYAVVADTTDGATPYTPLMLAVIGESLPGRPFAGTVGAGEAVRIMTGAPVPAGCDAVLPAEWVEPERMAEADSDRGSDRDRPGVPVGGRIKATASVSPGKHVGRRGEDIAAGTTVLAAGRLLRPQDVGALSSIGIADLQVVRRPRVRLVITGNELLPAGSRPEPFRIADANGPMLAALAERDGAVVDFPGLVPDEAEAILTAMHADADVVLVSGGSSVGAEDLAPMLLAAHGELAVHGIAMRPSSPTGMGRLGERIVFLLPGNPVSSLCAYDFFAGRAVRVLGGRPSAWPYRAVRGRLTRKISSPVGRLDYARVRVIGDTVEPLAVAGASILSSTTRADGFVIVDENSEGYGGGAEVTAWLYA